MRSNVTDSFLGARPETLKEARRFYPLTKGRRAKAILKVENRGILPSQLSSLVDFIENESDQGGELPTWRDGNAPCPTVADVNLYQVTNSVIKPLTRLSRLSYIEAVTEKRESQIPRSFVSHWWGLPVLNFMKCVLQHQNVRGFEPEHNAYWVCAYANNQHELGADLGTDPMTSSFLKAMRVSDTVLLILDPHATPFKRVWCCFEEGVTALAARGFLRCSEGSNQRAALKELAERDGFEGRKAPLLLDIATVDSEGTAQLLLEGLSVDEQYQEEMHQREPCQPSGWDMKSERETRFPLEVVREGLTLDIITSQASQEADRTRILNALASRPIADLDADPLHEHENYDTINQVVRSILAIAAFRSAAEKETTGNEALSIETLARVIGDDATRTDLELHLGKTTSMTNMNILAVHLKGISALKTLTLNLNGCKHFCSVSCLAEGLSELSNLETLSLDFSRCTRLTDISELGSALEQLPQLLRLSVKFRFTGISSAKHFGLGLASLTSLQQLNLNFRSTGLASVDGLSEGLAALVSLRTLTISFRHCRILKSLTELGAGLVGLPDLEELFIDLSGCRAIRKLTGFGSGISHCSNLKIFDVDFNGCRALRSIADLGWGIAPLRKLRQLDINFTFCKGISDVDKFLNDLSGQRQLERLALGFSSDEVIRCEQVSILGQSLSALSGLRSLSIDLSCCRFLREIDELAFGLQKLFGLRHLYLNLRYTAVTEVEQLAMSLCQLSRVQEFLLLLTSCRGLPESYRARYTQITQFCDTVLSSNELDADDIADFKMPDIDIFSVVAPAVKRSTLTKDELFKVNESCRIPRFSLAFNQERSIFDDAECAEKQ